MNGNLMCVPPPRGGVRAVGSEAALWPEGTRTLGVRFLDGTAEQQAAVRAVVQAGWNAVCALQFVFGQDEGAPVRVTFQGVGAWSYVGTTCLQIPAPAPTLTLAQFDPAQEEAARRVVLHEFGHVLGLEHEHRHPGVRIPWDREAVYAHYRQAGWTPEMVEFNVLAPLDAEAVRTTAYDAQSIMLYAIDASLVTDPAWAAGWNTDLSAGDVAAVQAWYGAAAGGPPGKQVYVPYAARDG